MVPADAVKKPEIAPMSFDHIGLTVNSIDPPVTNEAWLMYGWITTSYPRFASGVMVKSLMGPCRFVILKVFVKLIGSKAISSNLKSVTLT